MTGVGINFALFSAHATKVELCLLDSVDNTAESTRIALPEQTDMVWHGDCPDIRPNQLYGYRVHGPYDPRAGHRFNQEQSCRGSVRAIRRSDDSVGGRDVRVSRGGSRRGSVVRRSRQRAVRSPGSCRRFRLYLGGRCARSPSRTRRSDERLGVQQCRLFRPRTAAGRLTLTSGAGPRVQADGPRSPCDGGFTLADLISYTDKHNEATLEDNRDGDGESNNLSWNCGVEGATEDPQVRETRLRLVRNMLATLLISQGVPMIAHGDELSRTQRGNNNACCQDNELTWIGWNLTGEQRALMDFAGQLIRVRASQPVLRRRKYFQGRSIRGGDVKDVAWLAADGQEMTDEAWNADFAAASACCCRATTSKKSGGAGSRTELPGRTFRPGVRYPAPGTLGRRLQGGLAGP